MFQQKKCFVWCVELEDVMQLQTLNAWIIDQYQPFSLPNKTLLLTEAWFEDSLLSIMRVQGWYTITFTTIKVLKYPSSLLLYKRAQT